MSGISANHTGGSTQAERTTRPNILKRWLAESGGGITGTATGGTTTTLIDTANLMSANRSAREWVGCVIRMTNGAFVGNYYVVNTAGYDPVTGTLTFLPNTGGGGITAGMTYELWRIPFAPKLVLDELDVILKKECWLPCFSVVSEVPDFDMEQSGTSAWVGTNATLAKTSWGLSTPGVNGKQALRVTTTAANGYVAPANDIGVVPGINVLVGATFTPADPSVANTGSFVLRDMTNGVDLYSVSIAQKVPTRILKDVQIPANCYSISIRMGSAQDGVAADWDDAVLLDLTAHDFPFPWWISNYSQIKGVYRQTFTAVQNEPDLYTVNYAGVDCEGQFDYVPSAFGNGAIKAVKRSGQLDQGYYVFGTRNETAFASDSEEKVISENWVVAKLEERVAKMLYDRASPSDRGPLVERINRAASDATEQESKQAILPQRLQRASNGWREYV